MNDVDGAPLETFLIGCTGNVTARSPQDAVFRKTGEAAMRKIGQIIDARCRRRGIPSKFWTNDDTQEVTQSTLLKFLAHVSGHSGEMSGSRSAYLIGIVENEITNYLYNRPIVSFTKRDVEREEAERAPNNRGVPLVTAVPIVTSSDDAEGKDLHDESDDYARVDAMKDMKSIRTTLSEKQNESLGVILESFDTGESRVLIAARHGWSLNEWKSREKVVMRKLSAGPDTS